MWYEKGGYWSKGLRLVACENKLNLVYHKKYIFANKFLKMIFL